MTAQAVVELGRETIITCILVAAPILAVGFIVGLAVSFLQAITQIQEMTVAFVPKLLAIGASIILFGSWMLKLLMDYTIKLLGGFQNFISF
ncbi:flagellar biosynthesis protein FliQ [bacterium]|nr:flagellar biosynthesis protein FliQ [bacterium]